jgi:hypothetical protein
MSNRSTRRLATHRDLIEGFAIADCDKGDRIDFGEFRLLLEGLRAEMSHRGDANRFPRGRRGSRRSHRLS